MSDNQPIAFHPVGDENHKQLVHWVGVITDQNIDRHLRKEINLRGDADSAEAVCNIFRDHAHEWDPWYRRTGRPLHDTLRAKIGSFRDRADQQDREERNRRREDQEGRDRRDRGD
jgi:hypothetical protein